MFFLLFWLNTTKMAVLSVFWQKNGLGTLGVKLLENIFKIKKITKLIHF